MERLRKASARVGIALASLVLAGCVGARPDGAMCQASAEAAMDAYNGAVAQAAQNRNLTSPEARHQRVNILALSGGGAWGAYGGGFLNGWSVRHPQLDVPRPEFDVVTGVSTGAMIAPFALGQQLRCNDRASLSRGGEQRSFHATILSWPAILELAEKPRTYAGGNRQGMTMRLRAFRARQQPGARYGSARSIS